jgi:hypothetical protein
LSDDSTPSWDDLVSANNPTASPSWADLVSANAPQTTAPPLSIEDKIRATADDYGVTPDEAVKIGKFESNLDPTASPNKNNPNAAYGVFQTIPGTFADNNVTGGDIKDPDAQIAAGLSYIGKSKKDFQATFGRDPTLDELYSMHLFGGAGGKALLAADDDTPIADVVASYDKNPNHVKATVDDNKLSGLTVGQVKAKLSNWMSSGPQTADTTDSTPDWGTLVKANGVSNQFANVQGGESNLPPPDPFADVQGGTSTPVPTALQRVADAMGDTPLGLAYKAYNDPAEAERIAKIGGQAALSSALKLAATAEQMTPLNTVQQVAGQFTGQPTSAQQTETLGEQTQPDVATTDLPGRTAAFIGQSVPTLAAAAMTGGAAEGAPVLARLAQGVGSMAVPAAQQSQETYNQGINNGLTPTQAAEQAGIAGVGTLASGALPMSLGSGAGMRIASGAAIGAGTEEAQRVASNLALPADHPELQQDFDPVNVALAGGFGGVAGGVLGHETTPEMRVAHNEAEIQRLGKFIASDNPEEAIKDVVPDVGQPNTDTTAKAEPIKDSAFTPIKLDESQKAQWDKSREAAADLETGDVVTVDDKNYAVHTTDSDNGPTVRLTSEDGKTYNLITDGSDGEHLKLFNNAIKNDKVTIDGSANNKAAPDALEGVGESGSPEFFDRREQPGEERPIWGNNERLATFSTLAQNDDFFRHPWSEKQSIFDIGRDSLPKGFSVARTDSAGDITSLPTDKAFTIRTPSGDEGYLFQKGKEIWINVSHLDSGSQGSAVYSLAANYAKNNGLHFIGDPDGLSKIALKRRPEQMLAAAYKAHSTEHLSPHPAQLQGDMSIGVPAMTWKHGDDVHNVNELHRVNQAIALHEFPEIRNLSYNPASGNFETSGGRTFTNEDFDQLANQRRGDALEQAKRRYPDAFIDDDEKPTGRGADRIAAQITGGRSTLQRAVLTHAIDNGQGPAIRGRVLSRRNALSPNDVSQRPVQGRDSLAGLSYSRTDPEFYHRAYHGSPHDFDQFSNEHIGTGEGAQAYGHGLYFAGNEAVAKFYRDKLSDGYNMAPERLEKYFTPGRVVNGYGGKDKVVAFHKNDGYNWSVDVKAVDKNGNEIPGERVRNHRTQPSSQDVNAAIGPGGTGKVFHVELSPKEHEYLDWDKTLKEQSPGVQAVIHKVAPELSQANTFTGRDIYHHIAANEAIRTGVENNAKKSQTAGSKLLHDNGIPGIKYFDGLSRATQEGSHNYVIFNDKDVNVVNKYARSNPNIHNLSKDDVRNIIKKRAGGETTMRRLENSGLTLQSRAEFDQQNHGLTPAQADGVKGYTAKEGKPVLVHDQLAPEEVMPTAWHEALHANLKKIVGDDLFRSMAQSIKAKAALRDEKGSAVHPELNQAVKRIPKGTDAAHYNDEVIAQAGGDLFHQSFGRKLWDKITLGMNRLGFGHEWQNANEASLRRIAELNFQHFADKGPSFQSVNGRVEKPRIKVPVDQVPVNRVEDVLPKVEETPAIVPRSERVQNTSKAIEPSVKNTDTSESQKPSVEQLPAKIAVLDQVQTPKTEVKPVSEAGLTSVKNATVNAERLSRNVDELAAGFGKTDQDAWNAAKQHAVYDPEYGRNLASELVANPRPTTHAETMSLLHDRVRIKAKLDAATKEAAETTGKTDAQKSRDLLRMSDLEKQFSINDKAATVSGTETALSFRARQLMAADDYSLPKVVNKITAIMGEAPSSAMHQRLAAATSKIEELTKQLNAQEFERQQKIPPKKGSQHAKTLDTEFTSLKSELEKLAQLPQSKPDIRFSREDDIDAIIRKMARNRFAAGIQDPIKLIDTVHEAIGSLLGMEKGDVADKVSGYGITRKPTKDELTQQYNAMRAEMRGLSKTQAEIKNGPPDLANKVRQSALKNQISDLERRIEYFDTNKPAKVTPAYTAETEALKTRRDALKAELLQNTNPPPAIYPKDLNAIKDRSRATALKNQVTDLERRLKEYDSTPVEKRPVRYSEETKALKIQRDKLKADLLQITNPPEAIYPKDIFAQRNKTRQQQLTKQMADIKQRIASGNYEKTKRQAFQYNPDTEDLRARLNEEKRKLDNFIASKEELNKSVPKKIMDMAHSFQMFNIFTSPMVYPKLAAAVVGGHALSLSQAAMVSLMKTVPAFRRFAEQSERHGAGLTVEGLKARARGLAAAPKAAMETLIHGHSALEGANGDLSKMSEAYIGHMGSLSDAMQHERLADKLQESAKTIFSYPGRTHGMVKVFLSNPEVYHSYSDRSMQLAGQLKARGMDEAQVHEFMNRESTQASLTSKAMADAMESKMQGKNKWNEKLTNFIGDLDRSNNLAANTVGFALKSLVPVVRVGPNIIKQGTSLLGGGVKALAARGSVAAGKQEMTPEIRDYIIKNMAQQGVGIGLLMLGGVLKNYLGGVQGVTDNERKRQKGQSIKPDEASAGNAEIGKWAFHGAPASMLQIGADAAKVFERDPHSGHNWLTSFLTSLGPSTAAWAFHTMPETEQAFHMYDTYTHGRNYGRSGNPMGEVLGSQIRGMIEPQALQQYAAYEDPYKPFRKPKNIKQDLELGIPGLRETVPER